MNCQRKGTNFKITARLKDYSELVGQMVAQGICREDADRIAYDVITRDRVYSYRKGAVTWRQA